MTDKDKFYTIFVTALIAIYPLDITARFGVESKNLECDQDCYRVWCPEKFSIRSV